MLSPPPTLFPYPRTPATTCSSAAHAGGTGRLSQCCRRRFLPPFRCLLFRYPSLSPAVGRRRRISRIARRLFSPKATKGPSTIRPGQPSRPPSPSTPIGQRAPLPNRLLATGLPSWPEERCLPLTASPPPPFHCPVGRGAGREALPLRDLLEDIFQIPVFRNLVVCSWRHLLSSSFFY